MERRTDQLTARYVDEVVAFCQPDYWQCAIITLLDHGLSMDTVLRILAGPCNRRTYLDLYQPGPTLSAPRPPEPDLQLVIRDYCGR